MIYAGVDGIVGAAAFWLAARESGWLMIYRSAGKWLMVPRVFSHAEDAIGLAINAYADGLPVELMPLAYFQERYLWINSLVVRRTQDLRLAR